MMLRRRRVCAIVAALAVVILFSLAATATAVDDGGFNGDMYREWYPSTVTGWRGVSGYVWNYDWTLKSPKGGVVSSIYMYRRPINFVPGDGYFDGEGVSYVHLEAGITKDYGSSTFGFYQYCYGDPRLMRTVTIGSCPNQAWYGVFRIENYSMGNYSPENWRILYQDTVVADFSDASAAEGRPQFPILAGEALASAERYYLDIESPHREMMRAPRT
ncbi:MAG: hypothetical protein Q8K99_12695 [Actinomycetota bacterium]|nr:hypothetical protein [Actinomycetota bacterium]